MFRKNDGVTESFDEILGQGDELPEGVMTFVGAANREPGEPPTVTVFQVEAGEYIALCFVPLEGDGRPHFTAAQHAEFTVEAP